ncbi:MAG TPA: hypothetical protein VFJ82_04430 [Longimicrobium sp.]|nr:hypothetical protein [Longimicrobium sp.]
MKKLKLDLDTLQVQSFVPAPLAPNAGTVAAREIEYYDNNSIDYCDDRDGGVNSVGTCIGPTFCCPVSWKNTCGNSCEATCNNTLCTGCPSCNVSCGDVCSL